MNKLMKLSIHNAEHIMDEITGTEDEAVMEILIHDFSTVAEQVRAQTILEAFETGNYVDGSYKPDKALKGISLDEIGKTLFTLGYCLGRIAR